jgi:hypothetical protein
MYNIELLISNRNKGKKVYFLVKNKKKIKSEKRQLVCIITLSVIDNFWAPREKKIAAKQGNPKMRFPGHRAEFRALHELIILALISYFISKCF